MRVDPQAGDAQPQPLIQLQRGRASTYGTFPLGKLELLYCWHMKEIGGFLLQAIESRLHSVPELFRIQAFD